MRKFLLVLLGFVVGLVLGIVASGAVVGGTVGLGLGIGLASGICVMAEGGKKAGILTDEQMGQILAQAGTDLGANMPKDVDLKQYPSGCDKVMARLREG